MRDVHVVVVDEREAAAELRIQGVLEDALQVVLGRLVGGMRLAGEHDLHGLIDVVEDPRQAIRVVEDHLGALVGGEAPRVAERERLGIEHRARRDDPALADVLLREARAHALANEEEQIRTKYEFRKTDMMKKAFGYAEEELKRRAQQQK